MAYESVTPIPEDLMWDLQPLMGPCMQVVPRHTQANTHTNKILRIHKAEFSEWAAILTLGQLAPVSLWSAYFVLFP